MKIRNEFEDTLKMEVMGSKLSLDDVVTNNPFAVDYTVDCNGL
jgi:hypothetical protein